MAATILSRYIWLINILIQHKKITFKEIQEHWESKFNGLYDGSCLTTRTFHNHINAINEIFDVNIMCDLKDGYKYYIENREDLLKNNLFSWVISSFTTMNLIQTDRKMQKRILFDNIPSGQKYLSDIIEAMQNNKVVKITHCSFRQKESNTCEIEPYVVKVFNCRWYVIARNPIINKIRTYALDRIQDLSITDMYFDMPDSFSIDEYFEGCCGIINDQNIPKQHVVIKANKWSKDYISTLPIHKSQKIIKSDDGSTTFEYEVRPTFDFIQALLKNADQIEVLEPESLINQIKTIAANILSKYK